jgi:hypothetical protein
LADNTEITEAAWIKIAEGVAASKSLQKLEYGARSAFCFLIFIDRLGAEQNLLTYFLPSFCSLDGCNLSGAAGEAIGAALLTNKTLTDLKHGARSFAYLFFCTGSVQNKKLAYFSQFPSLLLCSLSDNDEITEAAWIKIAEGVAASKSLTDLKYGALLSVFERLFFCTARCRTKTCLLFIFLPPSFLQLGSLQPVWGHQRSN